MIKDDKKEGANHIKKINVINCSIYFLTLLLKHHMIKIKDKKKKKKIRNTKLKK